jgi:hypothetical protein
MVWAWEGQGNIGVEKTIQQEPVCSVRHTEYHSGDLTDLDLDLDDWDGWGM